MEVLAIVIALAALLGVALIMIIYLLWRLNKAESGSSSGGRQQAGRGSRTGRTTAPHSDASGEADQPMKLNWLLGKSGSVKGLNFHIGDQTLSIGRDVRNHIQISNDAASDRHAVLIGDTDGLTLIDVESSNGTMLNGEQIDSKVDYKLSDGDEIKIADATLIYRRKGRYSDDSKTQSKEISLQPKTVALSAVGSDGTAKPVDDDDLKRQVLMALNEHNGNYEAVAEALDLDVSTVQQIILSATKRR